MIVYVDVETIDGIRRLTYTTPEKSDEFIIKIPANVCRGIKDCDENRLALGSKALGAGTAYADRLNLRSRIKLPFWKRVLVLFFGRLGVVTRVDTEYVCGETRVAESHTAVLLPSWFPLLARKRWMRGDVASQDSPVARQ